MQAPNLEQEHKECILDQTANQRSSLFDTSSIKFETKYPYIYSLDLNNSTSFKICIKKPAVVQLVYWFMIERIFFCKMVTYLTIVLIYGKQNIVPQTFCQLVTNINW